MKWTVTDINGRPARVVCLFTGVITLVLAGGIGVVAMVGVVIVLVVVDIGLVGVAIHWVWRKSLVEVVEGHVFSREVIGHVVHWRVMGAGGVRGPVGLLPLGVSTLGISTLVVLRIPTLVVLGVSTLVVLRISTLVVHYDWISLGIHSHHNRVPIHVKPCG